MKTSSVEASEESVMAQSFSVMNAFACKRAGFLLQKQSGQSFARWFSLAVLLKQARAWMLRRGPKGTAAASCFWASSMWQHQTVTNAARDLEQR